MATSVGGVLTGRGCTFLIIDDPLKANEAYSATRRDQVNDWFRTTAFSRLDDKAEDVVIIVTQRLYPDGHLLAEDPHGWTVLSLPAIAEVDETWQLPDGGIYVRRRGEILHPARESAATLAGIKRTLGSAAFSAQYQQNPIPDDGEMIRWDWFQRYEQLPKKGSNDIVVQSWDTAIKADELHDYSVCTTWLRRNGQHYLIRVDRVRLGYPKLRRFIVACARRDAAGVVLIEDKGSGTSLIQDMRESGDLHAIAVLPEGDKVMRMSAQSVKIENGSVHLPHSAPWLDELRKELLLFPKGRFDDQVDSLSQYLAWRDNRETWDPEECFAIPLRSAIDGPHRLIHDEFDDEYWD